MKAVQLQQRDEILFGAPGWVSSELIEQTIRVWQPIAGKPLNPTDALTILVNFAELFDAVGLLEQGQGNEEVYRTGTGQQS